MYNLLDKIFKIEEKGSTISQEIIAGIIVFFAIIYILPVNTSILSTTGMDASAVFTATAIASGIATLIMGLIANYPVALSAGMGMNAFFAFTIVDKLGYDWKEGLSLIIISSVIFLILTITGLRQKIINAIPKDLKYAISSGLGFFIAFIGLKMGGIIISDKSTFVRIGDLSNPIVLLSLFGIVVAFALTMVNKNIRKFSIVIAMGLTALLGLGLNYIGIENMPSFNFETNITLKETFGKAFINILPVLSRPESYAVIFSLIFVQLFDATATLLTVGHDAGFIDENGQLIGGSKAMLADSFGGIIGGTLGSSTVTSFAESTIGVESGARTGLASFTTGILFLISLVAYPLFSIFSSININEQYFTPVTSMALVAVGALLFSNLKNINWNNKIITTTTFLMIILMTLTYSISDGLGIGIIFYVIMMIASGKRKEVSLTTYGIALFFIISFIVREIILHM